MWVIVMVYVDYKFCNFIGYIWIYYCFIDSKSISDCN